jgi:hypothetical protein
MRFILHDEDGVPLRKFWSRDAAEKFLEDGYTILELKKEKRIRTSKVDSMKSLYDLGEPPF